MYIYITQASSNCIFIEEEVATRETGAKNAEAVHTIMEILFDYAYEYKHHYKYAHVSTYTYIYIYIYNKTSSNCDFMGEGKQRRGCIYDNANISMCI
jgi:hypothetical protein